jgi:diguanylate cyclase (GGDEF)-like protein
VDDWRLLIHESRLFQEVPASDLDAALDGSSVRSLAAGDLLLEAGQVNRTLFVVLSGSVGIHLGGNPGPAHAVVVAGECVGELSLLDGRTASADARVLEPTTVLQVDRDQLWTLIDSSPELARNLLTLLAGRVRHDDKVIAETTRLRRHFERAATIDALTGLRNRRWLDEMFAREIDRARRSGEPSALLMVDLDLFKGVNDDHGHLVGDAVLCRTAHALASNLRPRDLLARYGGEEFAVLLPATSEGEAIMVADRLRAAIADPTPSGEPLPETTVSVGVATSGAEDTLDTVVAKSDAALYRAKAAGRNRVAT